MLTHGWPGSFLDYVDMLPLLEGFNAVVPSLPGYGFSQRPPKVGIDYRAVAERWHLLMLELGYSRYGAVGGDFGAGISTFLALDHPDSVSGIYLTTPELLARTAEAELSREERAYLAVRNGWDATERGYSAIQSTNRLYNIQGWTVFQRGGHFASVEEPVTLAREITEFFQNLM